MLADMVLRARDWRIVRNEPGINVRDTDLPDGSTASVTTLEPYTSTRGHSHPHPELLYMAQGWADVYLDGEKHTLGQGGVIWIPGNVHHRVHADRMRVEFFCVFTGSREASTYGNV